MKETKGETRRFKMHERLLFDVIQRQDAHFRPERHYDLVVNEWIDQRGLTGPCFRGCRRVFFATSMNHVTHNRNLRRRHDLLRLRDRHDLGHRGGLGKAQGDG